MGLIEEIAVLGADTEDALTRFMNNAALYEKMLKKLPKVIEEAPVLPYVESGDLETALTNAHTLKGVTGNLSLTPLYKNYTEIVNLFREGEAKRAEELLRETLDIQAKIIEQIDKYV